MAISRQIDGQTIKIPVQELIDKVVSGIGLEKDDIQNITFSNGEIVVKVSAIDVEPDLVISKKKA